MRMRPIALFLCFLATATACREEPEEQPPTQPWPAPAAAPSEATPDEARTDEAPEARASFSIRPGSVVHVSLPAKEAQPSGTFRIVRGELQLDLLELSRSTGTVEVDLASILMHADKDAAERQYTGQARDWMNLGASRPDAEVERLRFARFVVGAIEELSHPAPHLGRRMPAPEAQTTAPDGAEAAQATSEVRRIAATVSGELEANGVRVRRKTRVQLDFHYGAPATVGLSPTEVRLSSAKSLTIPLSEHEITPRDAHGRLSSAELDVLGRLVGRSAQVTFQLIAVP